MLAWETVRIGSQGTAILFVLADKTVASCYFSNKTGRLELIFLHLLLNDKITWEIRIFTARLEEIR